MIDSGNEFMCFFDIAEAESLIVCLGHKSQASVLGVCKDSLSGSDYVHALLFAP